MAWELMLSRVYFPAKEYQKRPVELLTREVSVKENVRICKLQKKARSC